MWPFIWVALCGRGGDKLLLLGSQCTTEFSDQLFEYFFKSIFSFVFRI